ncbi:hypothetical protein MYAM1_003187 [Malassezia yamatoensis]|uniref:Ribosomal RNA-processing protein 43 n=1 Tax=Malassezia yamatoensis TaxID=253288 RepID=A0AAJ6CHM3_9BASI|nr:hypothetical protein MYAM1_003187 [Malassezia yamatoensis]
MAASEAKDMEVEAAIFKKLYPVDFLQRHLHQNVREDGRAFQEARPVSLATGVLSQSNGSALVRFGKGTMVFAAVHGQVTEPNHETPNEGMIVPSVDLSPLCSPNYRPGPPSDDAQALAHQLQNLLDHAQAIDRASLCIEPGVAVWCLYVDVVVVSADGNVLDSAMFASVAALAHCRLPEVVRCESASACVCDSKRTHALRLAYYPIVCSYGVYHSAYLLADVSAFEESLLSAKFIVGVYDDSNTDSDVFYLRHMGNANCQHPTLSKNHAFMEQCISQAQTHANVLRKLLHKSLHE